MSRSLAIALLMAVLLPLTAACGGSELPAGWTEVTSAPTARGELGATVAGGTLYVVGGLTGAGGATNLVEVYDFESDQWSTAAPLPEPRNHHAVAALGGRVYVFGGSTSFRDPPLPSAYVYDPTEDLWTQIADMPEPRWGAGAAMVDGTIYVVGGVGGDTSAVLAYDPQSDAWSKRAAPPTPREHLAVVAYQGRVYAIGGRWNGDNLNTAEVYDPQADTWTEITPLPTARSGLAAGVAEDKIVVAGGENPSLVGGKVFPQVEVYDPAVDTWASVPPLPTPRHGLAGASHDGMALFIGGSGRHGALSPTAWSAVVEGYRPE